MNGAIIGIAFILVGILLSGVGIYFFIKTKRIMAHEMGNEAENNIGQPDKFSKEYIRNFISGANPDLYPDVDWMDMMLKKNTSAQRYTLWRSTNF